MGNILNFGHLNMINNELWHTSGRVCLSVSVGQLVIMSDVSTSLGSTWTITHTPGPHRGQHVKYQNSYNMCTSYTRDINVPAFTFYRVTWKFLIFYFSHPLLGFTWKIHISWNRIIMSILDQKHTINILQFTSLFGNNDTL